MIAPLMPPAGAARTAAQDRSARGGERNSLSGAHGLRLGDAAERLSALADGLLVVPPLRAPLLFRTIHDMALMVDRERAGARGKPHRRGSSTASRSRRRPPKARGYDAGKKIVGRKRHIAVDTDGRLLMVNLTTADISDSAGAQVILDAIRKRWPWVKHLFADGAYDRIKLMDKAAFLDFVIEIVRRIEGAEGFQVLPRRWVVERTFGMDDAMATPRARL